MTFFGHQNGAALNVTDLRIIGFSPCVSIRARSATLTIRSSLLIGYQSLDASDSLVDINGTTVSSNQVSMRIASHRAGSQITQSTFEAHQSFRVLTLEFGPQGSLGSSGEFLIEDCIFQNNNVNIGMILSYVPTVLRRTQFLSNTASTYIAAYMAFNASASTQIEDCLFYGNSAPDYPAIYSINPTTVTRTRFWLNTATKTNPSAESSNGALAVFGANLTVSECDFQANAAIYGAAIYSSSHTWIRNSNFSQNFPYFAGSVCFSSSSNNVELLVEGCVFYANRGRHGSAIYANAVQSTLRVAGTLFQSHNSTGLGLITFFLKNLQVVDSSFLDNKCVVEPAGGPPHTHSLCQVWGFC